MEYKAIRSVCYFSPYFEIDEIHAVRLYTLSLSSPSYSRVFLLCLIRAFLRNHLYIGSPSRLLAVFRIWRSSVVTQLRDYYLCFRSRGTYTAAGYIDAFLHIHSSLEVSPLQSQHKRSQEFGSDDPDQPHRHPGRCRNGGSQRRPLPLAENSYTPSPTTKHTASATLWSPRPCTIASSPARPSPPLPGAPSTMTFATTSMSRHPLPESGQAR